MTDKIKVGDISDSEAIAIGEGATATVIHYPPPQFPLDNLPPPNPNFTGRVALLTTLAATFTQSSIENRQSSIVIAGLGGVGKTQLALAYAHAHRDKYDLIWQLQADDPAALDGDLRALGLVLNLPVQTVDAPTARQIVLSRLNGADWRWLLLYDNADQMDARSLRPYLPGGRGCVLITSRRQDWPGAQRLRLDVFTAEEALAFWQRRLGDGETGDWRLETNASQSPVSSLQSSALAALAAELGYLPLALEQAAAYMEKRQKSAAQYLALYRERRQELWARETPPDDYHATITTTWEIAFEYARQTPGAASLLNLCCFLAPDDIPLDVIKAHAEKLPEELAAVAGDEMALDDALAALQAYSLVTRTGEMLAMHRLVQTVARDQMGEERGRIWVERAVDWLAKVYNYDRHDMATWPAAGRLLPHLTAATDLAVTFGCETSRTAFLNNKAGYYVNSGGSVAAALPYFERALAISEKALGPDHPDTARSLNNLGYLHRAMGQLAEARPYYERALAIREKALGPDHPDTASSLNNLGGLLDSMGHLTEARPCYERALTIREKALGPDHPDTARSLNNLGALLQAMGQLAEARPFYERALAIREKALGPDHPDTARSLNNLGGLHRAMGQLAEARPYYERALAIKEKALGPDHPDTALSVWWMGVLAQEDGDLETARSHYQRALAIYTEKLGPDHPSTKGVRGYLQSIS